MRKHLIVGAALVAAVAATVGATMAFAGGDQIPTCVAGAACPSFRTEWQLGPPQAFQFDANQVVGEATLVGLGGATARPTFPIYAYNWGVAQTTVSGGGGGGGAGKSFNQDFSIVKNVDELTPLVSLLCETGQHLPAAIVTAKSKTGTITYEFTDIQCSLDKQGESGDQDASPLEQFTWSYDAIAWTFTPKGGGAPVRRCFNLTPSTTPC